jgi:hypothetical protein
MANVVVFGLIGEPDLWIADLESGTVRKIDPPSTGALKAADDLRRSGASVSKGVNLALLASSSDAVASGQFDG